MHVFLISSVPRPYHFVIYVTGNVKVLLKVFILELLFKLIVRYQTEIFKVSFFLLDTCSSDSHCPVDTPFCDIEEGKCIGKNRTVRKHRIKMSFLF